MKIKIEKWVKDGECVNGLNKKGEVVAKIWKIGKNEFRVQKTIKRGVDVVETCSSEMQGRSFVEDDRKPKSIKEGKKVSKENYEGKGKGAKKEKAEKVATKKLTKQGVSNVEFAKGMLAEGKSHEEVMAAVAERYTNDGKDADFAKKRAKSVLNTTLKAMK